MFDGAHSPNPDCIVTIAAAANGVGLCFVRAAGLPDPDKLLIGSGKQTRFVRLSSIDVIDHSAVRKLLSAATEQAPTPPQTAKDLNRLFKVICVGYY